MIMTQDAEYLRWLSETCGYTSAVQLPDGRYACINPRPFNTQIITGRMGDYIGYSDTW
jgi:hypothetical protein